MKRALLTGVSGFIGRNIKSILEEEYELLSPLRNELDLKDSDSVRSYIRNNNIDILFHCANPNPVKNTADIQENMFEDSLRIFMNLYECRDMYDKMIYLGSGAEYDKTMDISNISETECFRSIPKDSYGFAKYVINHISCKSKNIHNLCVFGCYGPGDHSSKFITHCIQCCIGNKPITIRRDCRFNYIHVYDLARIMIWLGQNTPQHFMYNATADRHFYLSEIANKVKKIMNSEQPVVILEDGFNHEYTGSNSRLINEMGSYSFISLDDGIKMQIESEILRGK